MPFAVSAVPSIGSTAMSHSGPVPSPTRSPLNSIGASSFSPSPMTTTPFIETVETRVRMAPHRGTVGAVLVTPPDPAARGHRRRLGHPDQLQGEVAVGGFGGHIEFGRQVMMLGHRSAPFCTTTAG
ncbi:hypothetical protein SVIOM74S_06917 [Streptomyces violarus]